MHQNCLWHPRHLSKWNIYSHSRQNVDKRCRLQVVLLWKEMHWIHSQFLQLWQESTSYTSSTWAMIYFLFCPHHLLAPLITIKRRVFCFLLSAPPYQVHFISLFNYWRKIEVWGNFRNYWFYRWYLLCVHTVSAVSLSPPLLDPEHHVPLIKIPPDTSQEPRGGRDLQQSNGKKVKSNGIKKIIWAY